MWRRVVSVGIVSCLVLLSLAACQPARLGARCHTSDFGDDEGAWVLQCRAGHWQRALTKVQAAQIIAAANASKPPPPPPYSLDSVVAQPDGTIHIQGWSNGGDFPHITVNGEWAAVENVQDPGLTGQWMEAIDRPDVRAARGILFPFGFDVIVDSTDKNNSVCLEASNGYVYHPLTCANVTVPTPSSHGMPAWFLDSVTSTPGTIHAAGWALISHLPDSLPVQLLVETLDEQPTVVGGFSTIANADRPDLGALFPAAGSAHGFFATWHEAPGTYQVCLNPFAQDSPYEEQTGMNFNMYAGNPQFSFGVQCKVVTVPAL
jgi:hypothetical protein